MPEKKRYPIDSDRANSADIDQGGKHDDFRVAEDGRGVFSRDVEGASSMENPGPIPRATGTPPARDASVDDDG